MLRVAAAALSALGWGGCEPLDLALFPVTQDASVPPPIDVPAPPPPNPPADAGTDAGGLASPPPPSPCLPGAPACEACVLAASCAAGYVCHPASGECVPPCASGAPECPAGLVCGALDVCVECTGNAQCTVYDDDEPRCDVQRGVCVECLIDEHCTDDPFERPVCLTGGICGCASNDDCSGGASCELDEGHCEIEDD
jgi:hypothetical protein